MADRSVLCRVTPALVGHLTQLLDDAGVAAQSHPDGDLLAVTVPTEEQERARAVIGLVLPGLLEPQADAVRLSDRLVRRDAEPEGPDLLDGRTVFSRPSAPEPDADDGDPTSYDPADLDSFVPPPPPAIPAPRDQVSRFAWAGVILGPILLLLTALLGLPSVVTAAALAMFIVGFGTLIARKDDTPREGWDDGAVL